MFNLLNVWKRSVRRLGLLAKQPRRRRSLRASEPLEARTLLATLVSPTKVSYQDVDGDNVTVTFSKAFLTPGNVNSIFTFGSSNVNGSNTTKQQLRSINLVGVAGAALTTITTAAVRSATTGGDGFAALGQVNATGLDIGNVTIDGDLGRILAGDSTTSTQGLGALAVRSMGRYSTLTGATDLVTRIQGKLLSLNVKSDVAYVFVGVYGGVDGKIGAVAIGGSLIGRAFSHGFGILYSEGDMGPITITGDVSNASITTLGKLGNVTIGGSLAEGSIYSNFDMGAVIVKGDVIGGTRDSGRISTLGKLASVTIGGSLRGGYGSKSGTVHSALDMGPVSIAGSIIGGSVTASDTSFGSGAIVSLGKLASVTIGGTLSGGAGKFSGYVVSELDLGPVKVAGEVRSGTGNFSGFIQSTNGKLASVTIGGSLTGGSLSSGRIYSKLDLGAVSVKGDVVGGTDDSGQISTDGKLASVTIGGSLRGGSGTRSGSVTSALDMGPVTITGDVIGGAYFTTMILNGSGVVATAGKLASVTIGGSLIGGIGWNTGVVFSSFDLGAVKVTGDVQGGAGIGSGEIISSSKLLNVAIGGSLIGGQGNGSGRVEAAEIGTLTITGSIIGSEASGFARLVLTGCVFAGRIGTLTLGGSLIAGFDFTSEEYFFNGAIVVRDDIGTLTIKGSLIGNSTNRAIISARGQAAPSGTTDLAIGKLTVNGRVEYGQILAGYNQDRQPKNADAQIGPVIVGGDWIASDLVAGAIAGFSGGFGSGGDTKISGAGVKDVANVFSKITSVVIGGQVLGTFSNSDHSGFVAENIGSFKVKGGTTTYSLLAGNSNDFQLLSLLTGDVGLDEI